MGRCPRHVRAILLLRTVVLRSSTDAVLEPSGKRTGDVDGGDDPTFPGVEAWVAAEDDERF